MQIVILDHYLGEVFIYPIPNDIHTEDCLGYINKKYNTNHRESECNFTLFPNLKINIY